jgi:rhodanese-related sulfurtransferase
MWAIGSLFQISMIVDVCDAPELAAGGKLKGAPSMRHAGCWNSEQIPRARITTRSFRRTRLLIYCGSGGRAASRGKSLKDLGYQSVYNAGDFKELADAGLQTQPT